MMNGNGHHHMRHYPPSGQHMHNSVHMRQQGQHAHTYHQRNSPPMNGPYSQHVARHPAGPPPPRGGHPHGHGGPRMPFQVQHHGPMPPNGSRHSHGTRAHGHGHAPSPGMSRRMPLPPPPVMRPIPRQPGPGFEHHHAMQHQHSSRGHMIGHQYQHGQHQMQQRELYYHASDGAHHQMQPPPETPERGYQPDAPSPPTIPPPPSQYQQHHSGEDSARSSPSAMGDHQYRGKPPAWNNGSQGFGPLRESRMLNVSHNPMAPFPPQYQSHHYHQVPANPATHHSSGGGSANPYINENIRRFHAIELQRPEPMDSSANAGQTEMVPSPENQKLRDEQSQSTKPAGKKGPDVTMDAATMLLSLRTSASPATVSSQPTLEEQPSKDNSECTKKNAASGKHGHEELEDDDVPTLASSSSSLSAAPKPSTAPDDPPVVPKNFPTRLALPNDEAKLNSLHCFLRSELLEIFVVEKSANKSPTHSPGSSVGRVGLRCVFCAIVRKRHAVSTTAEHDAHGTAHLHRVDEAPMAVFYPKSIAEIYRLVTSWQRCHLRKCRNLPPDIRAKWTLLRENDKSRGKTHYWVTSAKEIGLVDCQSRAGGIRFAAPRCSSAASGSIVNTSSGSMDNDSVIKEEKPAERKEHDDQTEKQSYQPHSNPDFQEGPSQKHREATEPDLSKTAASVVESPMKDENMAEKVSPAVADENVTEKVSPTASADETVAEKRPLASSDENMTENQPPASSDENVATKPPQNSEGPSVSSPIDGTMNSVTVVGI